MCGREYAFLRSRLAEYIVAQAAIVYVKLSHLYVWQWGGRGAVAARKNIEQKLYVGCGVGPFAGDIDAWTLQSNGVYAHLLAQQMKGRKVYRQPFYAAQRVAREVFQQNIVNVYFVKMAHRYSAYAQWNILNILNAVGYIIGHPALYSVEPEQQRQCINEEYNGYRRDYESF